MSSLDINTCWAAGKVIHGYTMLTEGHEGSNSIWGKAKSPTGQTVFFKKYTTPSSVFSDWYQGYVKYQKELKRRIDAISVTDSRGRNQGPTYRFLEFFEELGPEGAPAGQQSLEYYQVLEYIDGAKDLSKYLASSETTWDDRMKFASVFMFAMKTLHADNVKIIHADLKPQNLLLIPTQNINGSSTYQIKIIDLDVSLLADIQAPWHGQEPYIGTQGYFSPEHLRGQVPTAKSDVFTCGLILYEILTTCGHPYRENADLETYEAYTAPVPKLRGTFGSPEKDAAVAQMLHRMLNPDPASRPTALEVQRTLIGSTGTANLRRPAPPPATR
ncbi:MAG: protein kinase, partial [Victivallales bacterium]|nr:protein kinase [Victivallales bacterium]